MTTPTTLAAGGGTAVGRHMATPTTLAGAAVGRHMTTLTASAVCGVGGVG